MRVCVICLDEMNDNDEIRALSCGHVFHTNCIRAWNRRKKTCPVCRASTMTASDMNEEELMVIHWMINASLIMILHECMT